MSVNTSYNFGTHTGLDDLIRDAYERAGIQQPLETGANVDSAILSGNLELSSWIGRGLNLWMIQKMMFGVQAGRNTYTLPDSTTQVMEVVSTTPTRLTNGATGTAFSTAGGTGAPANCFISGNTTGWVYAPTEFVPVPYIGWAFNTTNAPTVAYVGLLPLPLEPLPVRYRIAIACSWNTDVESLTVADFEVIQRSEIETFTPGQITWVVLSNPIAAPTWAVVYDGPGISGPPLAVQQLYFSQGSSSSYTNDIRLGVLSRSQWMAMPQKNLAAASLTPGYSYYFNQQLNPTMTLYPTPSVGGESSILYTNYRYPKDLVNLYETTGVPTRFYDALVAGIAARLATKFTPERAPLLLQQAERAYQLAAAMDYEKVPLYMKPDLSGSGGVP